MTTIIAPNDKVIKLWGKAKIKKTEYRLLKYIVFVNCDEGTLLHNCVTGELLLFSNEEKPLLEKLPCEYTSEMDTLIEKKFLVPSDYEDKKIVTQLRTAIKVMFPEKSIVSYTILPTTGCNARCFYCYESNMAHVNMSEETAENVIRYITDHCGGKKVHIQWFGGEPLVGKARIDRICRGLAEHNVEYRSTMVSNGYLFTESLVSHAKEQWKLEKVQITIDGTEDIYNQTKAYVTVSGSPYQRVMENIGFLLAQNITVELRMNLSRYNSENLKELIDELAYRFKNNSRLTPYICILFDDVGFKPVHHSAAEITELELKKVELESYMHFLGFISPKKHYPSLQIFHCMADSDAAVVINPKGEIGKCEHYIFEQLIGDINSEEKNKTIISGFKETVEWELCNSCVLYPTCVVLKRCQARRECSEIIRTQKLEEYKSSLLSIFKYYKSVNNQKTEQ